MNMHESRVRVRTTSTPKDSGQQEERREGMRMPSETRETESIIVQEITLRWWGGEEGNEWSKNKEWRRQDPNVMWIFLSSLLLIVSRLVQGLKVIRLKWSEREQDAPEKQDAHLQSISNCWLSFVLRGQQILSWFVHDISLRTHYFLYEIQG